MQSKKGSKIKQFLILWVIAEIAIVVIAGFLGVCSKETAYLLVLLLKDIRVF